MHGMLRGTGDPSGIALRTLSAQEMTAPFCGWVEPGQLYAVMMIEEVPDVPDVVATAASQAVISGPIARPTREPHCDDSGVMLRRTRAQPSRESFSYDGRDLIPGASQLLPSSRVYERLNEQRDENIFYFHIVD